MVKMIGEETDLKPVITTQVYCQYTEYIVIEVKT